MRLAKAAPTLKPMGASAPRTAKPAVRRAVCGRKRFPRSAAALGVTSAPPIPQRPRQTSKATGERLKPEPRLRIAMIATPATKQTFGELWMQVSQRWRLLRPDGRWDIQDVA
jgi:hypothetical protein